MRRIGLVPVIAAAILILVERSPLAQTPNIDRSILPIPEPAPQTITELDARNAVPPARFEIKAPANAPNVLIILLDDMGFGQSSAFGGPIRMPTLELLAGQGLKYNE